MSLHLSTIRLPVRGSCIRRGRNSALGCQYWLKANYQDFGETWKRDLRRQP